MISSGLIPTRRAVIDINRPCNAKCRMCYYTYNQSDWSKSFDEVEKELAAARERGNTSVDFTGGEPTIYPRMPEVIRLAESMGLHTCIITNGLAFEKVKKLAEAGCSEWLLSVHGFEERQDQLLNVKGAWEKINRTADFLNESGCFVRVNCTLTQYNFEDLPKLAKHYDRAIKPRIVNFINFNPHYEWGQNEQPEVTQRLNDVQVRASEVAPFLKQALDYLNARNYWVNVRYFPLCLLKGYESHVCNNPQVMFDPYEWDYGVSPKTSDVYLAFGREFQNRINSREGACGSCGMLNVCGGLHRNYAKIHGWSELLPYSEKSDYPYHFKSDLSADIVIPAYKPNENLQKLMSELPEKTVPPYNIIVVGKQQSAARNRNEGLRASRNPYVIMCDDDIAGLPVGWNRDLIACMRENRKLVAASARLMNPDGTVGRNSANNVDLEPGFIEVGMIPTACCIIRKNDVLFDEGYIGAGFEDTDYFRQLLQKHGGRLAIANTVRVTHLNEEKNGGGYYNEHNRNLYFSKWAGEEIPSDALPAIDLETLYGSVLLDPKNPDIMTEFVRECYRSRQFKLLETCLATLLKTYSNARELRFLFASCLFEQGKLAQAQQAAMDLLATFPDYTAAGKLLDNIRAKAGGSNSVPVNGATGSVKAVQAAPATIPGPYPEMKLLVGPGLFDPLGNEAFLIKALKRAADVKTFDHNPTRFDDVLRTIPAGWTPDAILIRDAEYYPIPSGLEQADYPVFCLLGDYNLSFNRMLPVLAAFDHLFCDLKGVRILNKLGFRNSEFFCLYGFDPEIHHEYGLPAEWDVLFIGNLNHSVQQDRENLLYELGSLKDRYNVHIATNIFGPEYARMLSRARLVFNKPIRDEVNMRFFEALGCGAVVLNPHLEELDILGFRPGGHYLAYTELEPAVLSFLDGRYEAQKLEMCEQVRQILPDHSYESRARQLVQKIASTRVDIDGRKLRQLPAAEIGQRWQMHHSDNFVLSSACTINNFDPVMVGWQKHLVNNELEIRNFDFNMWGWWIRLLAGAGLNGHLAEFLNKKELLLQSFNCYGEMAEKISGMKKALEGMDNPSGSSASPNGKQERAEMERMVWK